MSPAASALLLTVLGVVLAGGIGWAAACWVTRHDTRSIRHRGAE